jgi:aspartate racemase
MAAMARKLGILGGQGPLASAEFVKTIYACNVREPEQEMPDLVLLSDPSIPDRTTMIQAGREGELVGRLAESLETLERLGSRVDVLACFTLHAVLDRVPERLQRRVLSLIEVTIDEVVARGERQLMLCTTGTRLSRLFEHHPRWPEAAPYVTFPGDAALARVHEVAYRIKRGQPLEEAADELVEIVGDSGIGSFIAGCTELHLVSERMADRFHALDPLRVVARDLEKILDRRQPVD